MSSTVGFEEAQTSIATPNSPVQQNPGTQVTQKATQCGHSTTGGPLPEAADSCWQALPPTSPPLKHTEDGAGPLRNSGDLHANDTDHKREQEVQTLDARNPGEGRDGDHENRARPEPSSHTLGLSLNSLQVPIAALKPEPHAFHIHRGSCRPRTPCLCACKSPQLRRRVALSSACWRGARWGRAPSRCQQPRSGDQGYLWCSAHTRLLSTSSHIKQRATPSQVVVHTCDPGIQGC